MCVINIPLLTHKVTKHVILSKDIEPAVIIHTHTNKHVLTYLIILCIFFEVQRNMNGREHFPYYCQHEWRTMQYFWSWKIYSTILLKTMKHEHYFKWYQSKWKTSGTYAFDTTVQCNPDGSGRWHRGGRSRGGSGGGNVWGWRTLRVVVVMTMMVMKQGTASPHSGHRRSHADTGTCWHHDIDHHWCRGSHTCLRDQPNILKKIPNIKRSFISFISILKSSHLEESIFKLSYLILLVL